MTHLVHPILAFLGRPFFQIPRTRPWVVGAVLAPSLGKVVVAFLNGHLGLYDASSPAFDLQYELSGFDHATVALDVAKDAQTGAAPRACLVLGDVGGRVSVLEFPVDGATLFNTQPTKGIDRCR